MNLFQYFLQEFNFQATLKLLNNQVDKISEIGTELTIRLLIFDREDSNGTNISRCAFINQSNLGAFCKGN